MKGYFITGTDTGVGKTFISALLTLVVHGYYWKPVQSGIADEPSDQQTVSELTGLSEEHFYPSNYSLQASLSPNQAAVRERVEIDLRACHLDQPRRPLIVEGAGGVMVPLNDKHTMLDLMKMLNLPVVVVSRGGLGTINHTLLTIEALRQRDLNIHGIVFNGDLNPDNQRDIEYWGKVKTLFHMPRLPVISKESLRAWVTPRLHQIREKFYDLEFAR